MQALQRRMFAENLIYFTAADVRLCFRDSKQRALTCEFVECLRAAYPHAKITAVGHSLGGTLAQDTKGSDKQITFNKGTTLHDVLYKQRPKTQTDYRKTGDVISVLSHVQPGANKVKRSGKWKNPFHAHKL
jgi:hypothetical protein